MEGMAHRGAVRPEGGQVASVLWDRRGEARAALRAIVSDPHYGVAALSSPQVMSSLLKDLLPDAPREAGVLLAAAEVGLANTLVEYHGQGMDLGTASALAVESFASRTAFTPDACHWVVSELTTAAGFAGNAPARVGRQAAAPARTAPPRDQRHAAAGVGSGGGHRRAAGGRIDPADGREISRMAPKSWLVGRGLWLLIVIPTATLVVLGGMHITSSIRNTLAYQRVLQLANATSDLTTLVQRLQNERDQTVYYIAEGANGGRAAMGTVPGSQGLAVVQQQIRATGKAAVVVKADMEKVLSGSFSAPTKQEATAALADLALLPNLRRAATGTKLPALVVVQKYAATISDMLVFEQNVAQGASDPDLTQTVRVLGLVSRMKEDASQQRAILAAALIQGALEPASQAALVAAQSDQAANLSSFNLSATNAQRTQFQTSVSGSLDPLASSEEAQALSLGTSLRSDPTTADDWYGAITNEIDSQTGTVERDLVSQIIVRINALYSNAVASGIVAFVLLIALALLFAAVLGVAIIRRLSRDLPVPRFIAPLWPQVVRGGQRDQSADGFHSND
jgi:Nitrate and nitrite sensing